MDLGRICMDTSLGEYEGRVSQILVTLTSFSASAHAYDLECWNVGVEGWAFFLWKQISS